MGFDIFIYILGAWCRKIFLNELIGNSLRYCDELKRFNWLVDAQQQVACQSIDGH